jgi:hypothetical protein
MEQKHIFKQMIDFNRSVFDRSYSAMVIWQDQMERAARALQEQASWLPNETQVIVDEWVDAFKKGRDEFRKAVVGSFDKASETIGA